MKEYRLKIKGMMCSGCVNTVENALKKMPGVKDIRVSLVTKEALLKTDDSVKLENIKKEIEKAGYNLEESEESEDEEPYRRINYKKDKLRLIISIFLTFLLFLFMLFGSYFDKILFKNFIFYHTILSSFIIFILGYDVIKKSILSLKSFNFNMDTLIGIGAVASFLTGFLSILKIDIENFSMIGAMIITINTIGNSIKKISIKETDKELNSIIKTHINKTCSVIDGKNIIQKRVKDLSIGDIVIVKPGEKIPSDGIIFQGEGFVDESLITGESEPVYKRVGDRVIGFSINKSGAIKVKIEKVGQETFIFGIIRLIKDASSSKVPIQLLADKIASIFTPAILFISILSFIVSFVSYEYIKEILVFIKQYIPLVYIPSNRLSLSIFSSLSTLVIACPCALGLATPTALMVGFSLAYKNKILIKKGEVCEEITKIDTVVFDKTGTITTGTPYIESFYTFDKNFLNLAYSVEKNSNHPVSKAIISFIEDNKNNEIDTNISIDSFEYREGNGTISYFNGKEILTGKIDFLEKNGVIIEEETSKIIYKFFSEGKTITGLAIDKKFLGFFVITEKLRDESFETIKRIKDLGLKTVILSGDNSVKTEYIAKLLGIDEYYGNLMPDEKIKIVKRLQKEGRKVLMVGDGINDSPALKQSDISVAIGNTDIAIESSDIVLLKNNIFDLYKAIYISKKIFSKIKINLFWAFFYNLVFIPLAFFGIIHPVLAEIAMSLSSISVVLNSLLLKKLRVPKTETDTH
ncbi:MAG TPA: cation-translocating P-type ATPase [Spirochaetota bacterium]|nr:cation-translocating P-type ATPase [Spirochaetota bacterium]